jgi:hypothetical protein
MVQWSTKQKTKMADGPFHNYRVYSGDRFAGKKSASRLMIRLQTINWYRKFSVITKQRP